MHPTTVDQGEARVASPSGEVGGLAALVGVEEPALRLAEAFEVMPGRRAGWSGCWVIRKADSVDAAAGDPEAWASLLPGGRGGLARAAPAHRARPHPAAAASGLVLGQAVAVGLVGRVHNAAPLRQMVADRGALLRGDDDAELLLHLMAQSAQRTLVNRLVDALGSLRGGFSFALVTDGMCLAGRDPRGFRPLWIGTGEGACGAASDPGALSAMALPQHREVGVGELAILEPGAQPWTLRPWGAQRPAACVLEWIGLAPVDSTFEGVGTYTLRQRLGVALAATCPAPADLVAALPGACPVAASAFAAQLGLPMGAIFASGTASRGRPIALPAAVRGRRIALVHEPTDPAPLVRAVVASLRAAGARQIHLRATAPWLVARCEHGVCLPEPWVGAAEVAPGEAVVAWSRADSAAAISGQELAAALGRGEGQHCEACMGGDEPLPEEEALATSQLPLFTPARGGHARRHAGIFENSHKSASRNQHG